MPERRRERKKRIDIYSLCSAEPVFLAGLSDYLIVLSLVLKTRQLWLG